MGLALSVKFRKPPAYLGNSPIECKTPSEAPMVVLDGLPSCPTRVDIASLKLDCSSGRVLLKPIETMAPRALQNERSKHNAKEKGYPSIYPSFGPSISFPFFDQIKPSLYFPSNFI
jgi:hypothetical protein